MSKERAGSLVFLTLGILGFIFSTQLPMGKWNEPGAGVFPITLSILLVISGIAWFIQAKSKDREKSETNWRNILRDMMTPLRIVGLTLGFILSLQPVGYLTASMIYLFLLFLWVSHYKLWTALAFAVIFGTGSWYFFEKLLSVQLPGGFLSL
jgi:putative tricarboxylic transport membrane protein